MAGNIRAEFYSEFSESATESSRRNFDKVWHQVLAYEEQSGKSLDTQLTKQDYIDLFTSTGMRTSASLVQYKLNIIIYIRYLIKRGVLPEEQEKILSDITISDFNIVSGDRIFYYKNVRQLYEAAMSTMESAYVPQKGDNLYTGHAVLLFLIWYGADMNDLIEYRKEYVERDGIWIGKEFFKPPEYIQQMIVGFRFADSYLKYGPRNSILRMHYKDSPYLFRTTKSEKNNYNGIKTMLYRFNQLKEKQYSLTYALVRQSGIFYRAYMLECDSVLFDLSDPEFVSRVFCEDLTESTKRYRRLADYKQYKTLMK